MTATLNITVTRTIENQSKTLLNEVKIIDMETPDTTERIRLHLGMKIPEVFGRFSSLDVALSIEGPGQAANFEQFADRYLERMLRYEQNVINQVLMAGGQEPHFQANDGSSKE